MIPALADVLAAGSELTRLWSNAALIAGALIVYFNPLFGACFLLVGVLFRLGMYACRAGQTHVAPT